MNGSEDDPADRAARYAAARGIVIEKRLGFGYDGIVFATSRQSAVKVLKYEALYARERDVYLRLRDLGLEEVRGHAVPQLVDFDDELWVFEMSIVQPPFVLDFAGAYLDEPPDFPDDVLAEWEREKREQFGSRWPEVRAIMSALARHGIHLADVRPGNIMFAEDADEHL